VTRVVVLHSGGLDSTVCLLLALEQGHEVLSLGIDYGQTHVIELEYAEQQCRRFVVARKVVRVAWDKPEIHIPHDRELSEMPATVSPAFLPGRNVVFLALASAEAAGIGATEVWIGVNAIDFSGYPDCTNEFIEAFQAMLSVAIPNGPAIRSPIIGLSKPEIAAEASRLGLQSGDTWSCYRPQITERGVEPCKKCDACILHEYAWRRETEA